MKPNDPESRIRDDFWDTKTQHVHNLTRTKLLWLATSDIPPDLSCRHDLFLSIWK